MSKKVIDWSKVNCKPLIEAIDKYIAKEDSNLVEALDEAGFADAEGTVGEISACEEKVASCLKEFTNRVIEALNASDGLLFFNDFVWQGIRASDDTAEKLTKIFYDEFEKMVCELTIDYIAQTDPELAEATIAKSLGSGNTADRISKRTAAWAEEWSEELAGIMQLTSHRQIQRALTTSLSQGHSVAEFTRVLMDGGIRSEYHRARSVAVTEMLTAHSIAQQESYVQSPAVEEKGWKHTGGHMNDPRENHVAISGQRVPVNEPFSLDGFSPMFPRDPILPPEERINCHCCMQAVVNENILGLSLEERQALQQQAIDEDDGAWERELQQTNMARVGVIQDNVMDARASASFAGVGIGGNGLQGSIADGIIEVNKPFTSRREEIARLKETIGTQKVAVTGLSDEVLNAVGNSLEGLYQEFPQLKGSVQKIVAVNEPGDMIAEFAVRSDKGNITTSLKLNVANMQDLNSISEMVNKYTNSGYWTSKNGVAGILRHEVSHAIDFVETFNGRGVDFTATDLNGMLDRVAAFQSLKSGDVSARIVKKALSNLGMSADEWLNISDYVSAVANKKGLGFAYREAFAEAISDVTLSPLSAEITRLIREGGF